MANRFIRSIVCVSMILVAAATVRAEEAFSLDTLEKQEQPLYLASYDAWHGHFSIGGGYTKGDSDWDPASDRYSGVFDLDFAGPDWPVSVAVQLLMTYADDVPAAPNTKGDYSLASLLNVGVRKVFENDSDFEPFIGAGATIGYVTTRATIGNSFTNTEEEVGFGGWVGGGVYWNMTELLHLGFEVQYTYANIDLNGSDFNGGGISALLLFGWHW